jgi:CDP-diacylglycerol--serine O-phosphatidyltransferase
MISKIPTYSLKRILIPRNLTLFLLLGIGIYLSSVIFYTFETLFLTGIVYIALIPISFFHYKNKKTLFKMENDDETEYIL